MPHPLGTQPEYRRTPLSAEEKAWGEVNFAPLVARMLVASGRFRVSADTPDQVELFQGVARGERHAPAACGQLCQRKGDRDHLRPRGGLGPG
jgi:hypothetical protein